MLIFDLSRPGRRAAAQSVGPALAPDDLPAELLRQAPPPLPEVSELDAVRHYTRLSQRNFSIDTHFYPLGSCTMKYNPKVHEMVVRLPGFSQLHPLQDPEMVQGALAVIHAVEASLAQIAGMAAATIQPAAGAHGELLSLMIIRAYHRRNGQTGRRLVLIPDSAHGTTPASAASCGFEVKSIPTDSSGLTDIEALRSALDETVAALMLTNPSTLGLFERNVTTICELVHGAGGLVYCDGANMNAVVGIARPGDMGFDVMHFNLHKTFST
ncbi:MAG: aminotransferase class V-fold PLP-dependent enzyme, partial [Thiobacillaceae bacterium]|nr:aminotransferase class V-fold PLP-dependent enzyme [Thiobacillaceae bacterium]